MGGVCVCVCATPRTKLARGSAKFQLHGICSRFFGHSFRLPQGCLLPSHGTGPQTQLGKGIAEPFCRKHGTMHWKRFVSALGDAACAELVTA